jgi:hypothetical protein
MSLTQGLECDKLKPIGKRIGFTAFRNASFMLVVSAKLASCILGILQSLSREHIHVLRFVETSPHLIYSTSTLLLFALIPVVFLPYKISAKSP